MPDITKDKYDFAKVLKQTEMVHVDVGLPREVLIPWEDLPKVKSLWPQTGDYVLVTLRIDRENQMFARLASETIVEKMFTPVYDDEKQNELIKARPYRLLRIGSFYYRRKAIKSLCMNQSVKKNPD